jgi:SlyX protein
MADFSLPICCKHRVGASLSTNTRPLVNFAAIMCQPQLPFAGLLCSWIGPESDARKDGIVSDEMRLVQLEVLTTHQERTIAELSEQINEQWKIIDKMQRRLDALGNRFHALEEQASPDVPVTKPPHW